MIPGQNSSVYDATQPPGMTPESQQPPWWRVAQANTQSFTGDPKNQVMMALLSQQLAKMGQAMGPQPIQRRDNMAAFDLYGMPAR